MTDLHLGRALRRWFVVGPLLAVVLVLGGLLLGSAWWGMTASIVVLADGEEPVVVCRVRKAFLARKGARPVVEEEIDLRQWRQELVRLQVHGRTGRLMGLWGAGHVSCAAELVDPTGARPIEFAGWTGTGSLALHMTPLGTAALPVRGTDSPRFYYSPEDSLWHILRVPQGAKLRISLKPLLPDDLPTEEQAPPPAIAHDPLGHKGRSAQVTGPPPDVFIYLVDALRADHVGCYGYSRETSPAINAFAANATLYEHAQTASTWTRPSVATLLTGIYPSVHGAMHMGDALDQWPALLPEILQQAGYKTCCITTNGSIGEEYGFKQGYDEFICMGNTAEWVNYQAARWLSRQECGQAVFMYLHTVEPHSPYTPGPDSLRRFDRGLAGSCDGSLPALEAVGHLYPKLSRVDIEHLLDLYDAEILEADEGFRGLLEILRRRNRFDNALIVFLSDHGESFAEHDTMQHGYNLSQEEMHVPLIIRFSKGRLAGVRVPHRVSLVDVFPTILAELGLVPDVGYPVTGINLAALASGDGPAGQRRIYSEVSHDDSNDLDLAAVIDEDGYKRVVDLSVEPGKQATKKSVGLWNTAADFEEAADLSKDMQVRAAYGDQLTAHWLLAQRQVRESVTSGPAPHVTMSDEVRQQLKALGYVR